MKQTFYLLMAISLIVANSNLKGQTNKFPANGNAGIGTTTPGYKLEVIGDINVTGVYRIGGSHIIKYDHIAKNFSLGQNAGYFGTYNTAVGSGVLRFNHGNENTAIGHHALYKSSGGNANTAVGAYALANNISGDQNTALGEYALLNNKASFNTAVGYRALENNGGFQNTAVGNGALNNNSAGSYNTATGNGALAYTTYGYDNTANGFLALNRNTTGLYNTATGSHTMEVNGTGNNNTANGVFSLRNSSSGHSNVAIGTYALYSSAESNNLVAVGDSALYNMSTGARYNTGTGSKAMYSGTSASFQTANGYQALYSSTISFSNTAIGYTSLYAVTSGSYNTAVGTYSLRNNVTGANNTAIGELALESVTSGTSNSALGYGADISDGTFTNTTAIGYNALATAPNQIMLGNMTVSSVKAAGSFVIYSDGRFKTDVRENVPGLAFINQLRPVTYHYNINGMNDKTGITEAQNKNTNDISKAQKLENTALNSAISLKEKKLYTGFVAQEVEAAAKRLNYDFSGVYQPQNDKDLYGLSYADFVVPLVKAVQELSKNNDTKQRQIDSLNERLTRIETMLNTQSLNNHFSERNSLNQVIELGMKASINQNIPNPFNGQTVIDYFLPINDGNVYVNFITANGQTLKSIKLNGKGNGTITLKAHELPSGTYQYALIVGGKLIDSKNMVLSK